MTTTVPSATLDMSGVIGSILHTYEQSLVAVQQQVTGDPAAVGAAGQKHAQQAQQLAGVISTARSTTSGLAPDWEGSAHDAFATTSGHLTDSVEVSRKALTDQAQRMAEIAQALSTARARMDALLAQFRQLAQTLITEARTASVFAQAQFVQAAQSLGQGAVGQSKGISADLAGVLVRGSEIRKPDDAGVLRFDQADPLKKALAQQPWFRNLYKGVFGGEPNPENLTMGPLGWLGNSAVNPATKPASNAWFAGSTDPTDPNSMWGRRQAGDEAGIGTKAFRGTDVTLAKTEDHVVADGSWDGKATDSGAVGDGTWQTTADAHVGPRVTDNASLSTQAGQLQGNVGAKATLFDASAGGAYDNGPLHAQGSGSVIAGATGNANAAVGWSPVSGVTGVSAHAGVFAGVQATAQGSADVGGIGVGGEATAQAGIGAQLDGQATYTNGHVVIDARAGAALGIGGTVGAHIDVDVPKITGEIESGAASAWQSVSATANEASAAIGHAWAQAGAQ